MSSDMAEEIKIVLGVSHAQSKWCRPTEQRLENNITDGKVLWFFMPFNDVYQEGALTWMQAKTDAGNRIDAVAELWLNLLRTFIFFSTKSLNGSTTGGKPAFIHLCVKIMRYDEPTKIAGWLHRLHYQNTKVKSGDFSNPDDDEDANGGASGSYAANSKQPAGRTPNGGYKSNYTMPSQILNRMYQIRDKSSHMRNFHITSGYGSSGMAPKDWIGMISGYLGKRVAEMSVSSSEKMSVYHELSPENVFTLQTAIQHMGDCGVDMHFQSIATWMSGADPATKCQGFPTNFPEGSVVFEYPERFASVEEFMVQAFPCEKDAPEIHYTTSISDAQDVSVRHIASHTNSESQLINVFTLKDDLARRICAVAEGPDQEEEIRKTKTEFANSSFKAYFVSSPSESHAHNGVCNNLNTILFKNHGSMFFPFAITFKNLGVIDNMIAGLLNNFEALCVHSQHAAILRAFFAACTLFCGEKMLYHIALLGPNSKGKSFIIQFLTAMLTDGRASSLSTISQHTTLTQNAGITMNCVVTQEEAIKGALDDKSDAGTVLKNCLTSDEHSYATCVWKDNQKITVMCKAIFSMILLIAANDLSWMSPAMTSRFYRDLITNTDRPDAVTISESADAGLIGPSISTSPCIEFTKFLQTLTDIAFFAIRVGLLADVDLSLFRIIRTKAMQNLRARNLEHLVTTRDDSRMRLNARVLTVQSAILKVFCLPLSTVHKRPFTMADIMLLEPYLFCGVRETIASFDAWNAAFPRDEGMIARAVSELLKTRSIIKGKYTFTTTLHKMVEEILGIITDPLIDALDNKKVRRYNMKEVSDAIAQGIYGHINNRDTTIERVTHVVNDKFKSTIRCTDGIMRKVFMLKDHQFGVLTEWINDNHEDFLHTLIVDVCSGLLDQDTDILTPVTWDEPFLRRCAHLPKRRAGDHNLHHIYAPLDSVVTLASKCLGAEAPTSKPTRCLAIDRCVNTMVMSFLQKNGWTKARMDAAGLGGHPVESIYMNQLRAIDPDIANSDDYQDTCSPQDYTKKRRKDEANATVLSHVIQDAEDFFYGRDSSNSKRPSRSNDVDDDDDDNKSETSEETDDDDKLAAQYSAPTIARTQSVNSARVFSENSRTFTPPIAPTRTVSGYRRRPFEEDTSRSASGYNRRPFEDDTSRGSSESISRKRSNEGALDFAFALNLKTQRLPTSVDVKQK